MKRTLPYWEGPGPYGTAQFSKCTRAESDNFWVFTFGEFFWHHGSSGPGSTDAALPFRVESISVADEDPLPVFDQLLEGGF